MAITIYDVNDSNSFVKSWKKNYKILLVFYHGGPFGDGNIHPKVNDNMGYTGKIYEKVINYFDNEGIVIKGAVIAPAATQNMGVNTGEDFLIKNYQIGDRIIIYGYSYGGDNAVNLAEKIHNVKIDLMLIVDSSDGPFRGITVDMEIPDNVSVAHNYFQDNSSGKSSTTGSSSESSNSDSSNIPGSRGYIHTTKGKALVYNHYVKDSNHATIQQKSENHILNVIKERCKTY